MKISDLNTAKIPIVKIDKTLERFRGKILFPEKLELAKKLLANVKLPELKA
jgi:pheromone shutdown protein TraB